MLRLCNGAWCTSCYRVIIGKAESHNQWSSGSLTHCNIVICLHDRFSNAFPQTDFPERERQTPANASFQTFTQELHKVFSLGDSGSETTRGLMSLRQGDQLVADFSVDFAPRPVGVTWALRPSAMQSSLLGKNLCNEAKPAKLHRSGAISVWTGESLSVLWPGHLFCLSLSGENKSSPVKGKVLMSHISKQPFPNQTPLFQIKLTTLYPPSQTGPLPASWMRDSPDSLRWIRFHSSTWLQSILWTAIFLPPGSPSVGCHSPSTCLGPSWHQMWRGFLLCTTFSERSSVRLEL